MAKIWKFSLKLSKLSEVKMHFLTLSFNFYLLVIRGTRMTATNFACHHDNYRRAIRSSNSIFEEFFMFVLYHVKSATTELFTSTCTETKTNKK